MKKLLSIQACAAIALVLLGVTNMAGWILHDAAMVQIQPHFGAMVFSAALCFLLLGSAFLLPLLNIQSAIKIQAAIGWGLVAIAALILIEYIANRSLLIDFSALHSWLKDGNPHPGRMAPGTAAGFMLAGLALIMMPRARSQQLGAAVMIIIFLIFIMGFFSLTTYSLQLDLLYAWFPTVRMAQQTAFGMAVSGVGLWSNWQHSAWYRMQGHINDDEKIGYVAAAILTVFAVTAGVVGFAAQQTALERILSQNLLSHLRHQTTFFQTIVRRNVDHAERAAANRDLIRLVRASGSVSGASDSEAKRDVVAQNLIAEGFGGVALFDLNNREILRRGHFGLTPQIEADLGLTSHASLRWDGGFYLNSRSSILDNGRIIGTLEVEQPLPLITEQFSRDGEIGATGEMGICVRRPGRVLCFPERRNPVVFTIPRPDAAGRMTAMGYAVDGHSGVFNGLDYRGRHVIAAYGPLSATGLGIAIKQDTEELYRPMREQLQWYLPLLLLLVAGGSFALRAQVKPLVSKLLQSEREATNKELYMRTVIDNIAEGIITLDKHGAIESFNMAASRIFGYAAAETIGQNIKTLIPVELNPLADMQGFMYGGEEHAIGQGSLDVSGLHKNGRIIMLELAVNDLQIGERRLLVGIVRDITARKEAERARQESEARFREITETLGEGVIVTDRKGIILFSNPAAQQLLGYTEQELHAQYGHALFHHSYANGTPYPAHLCEIGDVVRTGQSFRAHDETFWRKDGSILPVSVNVAPIYRDGLVVGSVLAFHDIIERKMAVEQIQHMAHFDILTDLPNRGLLNDRLRQAMATAKRDMAHMALMFIDLDKFKQVNDTLGHNIGDLLLKEVAMRMQHCLRESDTVARMGGDEFIVLLPFIQTELDPVAVAHKILQTLNQPFELDGHTVHISASIGVAVYPEQGDDEEQLLRNADNAMYQAKENGGAATVLFGKFERVPAENLASRAENA
ncbi:MAG: diguanylate cyclase domain-containing protein [Burkholderiales bacterium]